MPGVSGAVSECSYRQSIYENILYAGSKTWLCTVRKYGSQRPDQGNAPAVECIGNGAGSRCGSTS